MTRSTGGTWRIGELSARSGVSRDTLRYYERIGLLGRPARSAGGFRRYPIEAAGRVRFIKQAQALGLSLSEIRELVTFSAQARPSQCRRVHDILIRRLSELDGRLREMQELRGSLRASLADCERALIAGEDAACPVVDTLDRRQGTPARPPHDKRQPLLR